MVRRTSLFSYQAGDPFAVPAKDRALCPVGHRACGPGHPVTIPYRNSLQGVPGVCLAPRRRPPCGQAPHINGRAARIACQAARYGLGLRPCRGARVRFALLPGIPKLRSLRSLPARAIPLRAYGPCPLPPTLAGRHRLHALHPRSATKPSFKEPRR